MDRIILWWVGFFIRRATSGNFSGWLRTYTDWRVLLATLRRKQ